jgi:glycosyltransferase involved in cell wall biosynthesis
LLGDLSPREVPAFFADIDVYLFPSHFEGCPNALLEAMMSGCVPVSWVLEGITDYIVRDGSTGVLAPRADYAALAYRIAELAQDRDQLVAMSAAAAADARSRFNSALTAEAYATLFRAIAEAPAPDWEPKSWDSFTVDPNFSYGFRDLVPESWYQRLRRLLKWQRSKVVLE